MVRHLLTSLIIGAVVVLSGCTARTPDAVVGANLTKKHAVPVNLVVTMPEGSNVTVDEYKNALTASIKKTGAFTDVVATAPVTLTVNVTAIDEPAPNVVPVYDAHCHTTWIVTSNGKTFTEIIQGHAQVAGATNFNMNSYRNQSVAEALQKSMQSGLEWTSTLPIE